MAAIWLLQVEEIMKTIKELADSIGVSKTAIRNYMDDDFRAKYTAKDSKGVITITPEGCELLSENFEKQPENTANNSPETELCTIPVSVLKTLQDQLAAKDKQIEELTKLLDQEQQLHAGTITQALPESKKKKWYLPSWIFRKED